MMVKDGQPNFRWGYAIFVLLFLMVFGFITAGIISLFVSGDFESLDGNVAIIPITGVIMGDDSDFLFDEVTSSTEIVKLIRKADDNPKIKAIVLEINSPGGSAVASAEIADAVKKTNKTTVAWIREVGASGAYWVASAADYAVANRVSITGSIGVIASYLEFPGLLEEYNVTYRRLVAGKYKDIGTPLKEMTPEEEIIFQKNLDEIRDYFVEEVAKNRGLTERQVDSMANGLFYLGAEAKQLGLIDELGGKDEVIRYIEEKENIVAETVEYKKEKGFFDLFRSSMSESSYFVGKGIGNSLFKRDAVSDIRIIT
jgi:protease IV